MTETQNPAPRRASLLPRPDRSSRPARTPRPHRVLARVLAIVLLVPAALALADMHRGSGTTVWGRALFPAMLVASLLALVAALALRSRTCGVAALLTVLMLTAAVTAVNKDVTEDCFHEFGRRGMLHPDEIDTGAPRADLDLLAGTVSCRMPGGRRVHLPMDLLGRV